MPVMYFALHGTAKRMGSEHHHVRRTNVPQMVELVQTQIHDFKPCVCLHAHVDHATTHDLPSYVRPWVPVWERGPNPNRPQHKHEGL